MVDPTRPASSVLAINSGSSSVKCAVFTFEPDPQPLYRATLDNPVRATIVEQILNTVRDRIAERPLSCVGHRLVHGGPEFRDPQIVDESLIEQLLELVRLAPNHLPDEIGVVQAMRTARPGLRQIVCFDTAFHRDLPEVAYRLAIPMEYASAGVRRYGFHGLSCTFLMEELRRRAPAIAGRRVILAHLGNGSSLSAVRDGRSVDTSMGFTPIGGVVMSTRAGDLDPGVVTYIARSTGFDADRVERELSHRSGVLALSERTSDMRELLAGEADDDRCGLAVAIYCYEIKKRIGAYAAALGGLDALVFSGGIGEHSAVVRSRICTGLEFLGVTLDEPVNGQNAAVISAPAARVEVHVIPTDEELVIARSAYEVLH